MTTKEIKNFQKEILTWYKEHQRSLPWRKDRDPYHILLSEVMLQQTQVSRVIPKYEAWLKKFPTIESLAQASVRDVLEYWSGLGYNRRALYLQKFAQVLVYSSREQSESRSSDSSRLVPLSGKRSNNKIIWPQTEKELRSLPGIGEYTARALLCFAFDKQIAVVDTNVRKVILIKFLSRHPEFISGSQIGNKKQELRIKQKNQMLKQVQHDKILIQEIADMLLPKGKAYEWNQALMDYASAMLKEHKIPIQKQSKFKDSDRYFRGLTLRILLTRRKLTFKDLLYEIKKANLVEEQRYQNIIDRLVKEGFIIQKRNNFTLPE